MANLVSDKISISRPLQFIIIAVFSGVLSTFFLSGLVGLYAEKNTIQIRQTKHIYEEFEDFMDERFVLQGYANKISEININTYAPTINTKKRYFLYKYFLGVDNIYTDWLN